MDTNILTMKPNLHQFINGTIRFSITVKRSNPLIRINEKYSSIGKKRE